MIEITYLPVDLPRWDVATGDALAVCLFSDVRPLRGAAGLLDWRLNGKLSSWIESGRFSGDDGEQTLFPSGKRVVWRSVLALGLGASKDFDEARFRGALKRGIATMKGLGLRKLAMALPGREAEKIAARRAIELVLDEAKTAPLDELTVIDTLGAQKEMADVIRRRRQGSTR